MKTNKRSLTILVVVLSILGLAALAPIAALAAPATASPLTQDEINGLLYVREEEKLAHDVYFVMYQTWGLNIFQNIANSEQAHTDAIKTLLDTYGLPDPVAGNALGEFTNPDLQALYDQLVAQGSQSLSEALKVGAAIEEIDILDLEDHLAQSENVNLQQVYTTLKNGSYNHLRSFVSTLKQRTGETYQPQYLSEEAYKSIINGATAFGGRGKGKRP